jgi:hypothetical protein
MSGIGAMSKCVEEWDISSGDISSGEGTGSLEERKFLEASLVLATAAGLPGGEVGVWFQCTPTKFMC